MRRRTRPLPPPPRRPSRIIARRPDREWPTGELRRFAQGRSRTHLTVAAILDLLAERPGQQLPVSDIAAGLGRPVEKVIGALGGLTRIVKANHDYPAYGLPLQRSREPATGRSWVICYRVSAEQARRWRTVRQDTCAAGDSNGADGVT